MMISSDDSTSLISLLNELGKNAHGIEELKHVENEICNIKKTEERVAILNKVIVSTPITWDNVWKDVWAKKEDAESNFFHFLQGDLIDTRRTLELGKARSDGNIHTWLVLSTTCDISQGKNKYIRVSPAYPVYKSFKNSSDISEKERYRILSISSKLKLKRCFLFPSLDPDTDMLGYICMLDEIAGIQKDDATFATTIASLTEEGWHLFGAILKRFETQANMEDEVKIRSKKKNVVSIPQITENRHKTS